MLSIYRPDSTEREKDRLEEEQWENDGLTESEIGSLLDKRFYERTYITVRYRTKCESE